jgi:cytochrome bd ubiquinol oxidase subunit I
VPRALSFLTYQRWGAQVKGLNAFPPDVWPDNIPLLYFSYHIMVGLGTVFIAVMALAAFSLARGTLYAARPCCGC